MTAPPETIRYSLLAIRSLNNGEHAMDTQMLIGARFEAGTESSCQFCAVYNFIDKTKITKIIYNLSFLRYYILRDTGIKKYNIPKKEV